MQITWLIDLHVLRRSSAIGIAMSKSQENKNVYIYKHILFLTLMVLMLLLEIPCKHVIYLNCQFCS